MCQPILRCQGFTHGVLCTYTVQIFKKISLLVAARMWCPIHKGQRMLNVEYTDRQKWRSLRHASRRGHVMPSITSSYRHAAAHKLLWSRKSAVYVLQQHNCFPIQVKVVDDKASGLWTVLSVKENNFDVTWASGIRKVRQNFKYTRFLTKLKFSNNN
jgi:hypothetical protein